MVDTWLAKHKTIIAANYLSQRTEGEILREHNSSFTQWFKEQLMAKPPPMNSDKNKLSFAQLLFRATPLLYNSTFAQLLFRATPLSHNSTFAQWF
jgi:hypothetical protein